jgi:segregation and condensation protein A
MKNNLEYDVRIEQFEGPLDLLVQLIEKEKLDITEISLNQIADQYLQYLEKVQKIDPAQLAEFLYVASRLILIKSKALLPMLELTSEEEEGIEELKFSLAEYRRFKKAAQNLGKIYHSPSSMYSREGYAGLSPVFCPPPGLKKEELSLCLSSIIKSLPTLEKLPEEVLTEIISLKEKIAEIEKNLIQRAQNSFTSLFKGRHIKKTEIIVTFLALLELVKKKTVQVEQATLFENIVITKKDV